MADPRRTLIGSVEVGPSPYPAAIHGAKTEAKSPAHPACNPEDGTGVHPAWQLACAAFWSGVRQHSALHAPATPQHPIKGLAAMADLRLTLIGLGGDGLASLSTARRAALACAEAIFGGPRQLTLAGGSEHQASHPRALPYAAIVPGSGQLQIVRVMRQSSAPPHRTARDWHRRPAGARMRTKGFPAFPACPASGQGTEVDGAPPSCLARGASNGAAFPRKLALVYPAFKPGVEHNHLGPAMGHTPARHQRTARHG